MRVLLSRCAGSLYLCQILVHELDDDGAFADPGSYALYGAVAHVADDKDARNIGFEQPRIAVERPGSGAFAIAQKVGPGEDEAALIALDQVAEPFGARLRTNKYEEAGSGKLVSRSGALAEHGDASKPCFSTNFDDRRLGPDFDLWGFLNLLD